MEYEDAVDNPTERDRMIAELGIDLGKRANRIREATGITLGELADRMGTDASNLSTLLRGGRPAPSIQTVVRLADALGISLMQLLGLAQAGEN